MRNLLTAALLVAVTGTALAADNAGAGAADGPWTYFEWSTGVGSMIGPMTIDFSSESYLDVTDAFIDGDQFRVWVDGMDMGVTSIPTDDGASIGSDADAAFADPMWSSGTFGPFSGMKDVTFEVVDIAAGFDVGAGYYRTNVVPEPASLLGLALGGVLLGYRRR